MILKNVGAIPTPISRWLHKLLQSEGGTNNWESVCGKAAVDAFTQLAQLNMMNVVPFCQPKLCHTEYFP